MRKPRKRTFTMWALYAPNGSVGIDRWKTPLLYSNCAEAESCAEDWGDGEADRVIKVRVTVEPITKVKK